METKEMTERIRRKKFFRNNGVVLKGINLLRTQYVSLSELKYALEPTMKESELRDKRLKLVFTQYIFVECDLNEEIYYQIKSVFGVVRFLGFGKPESLKADEQAHIRLLWNNGKPIEASKIYTTSSGDKMVLSGILRNYQNSIISLDLRQRRAKVAVTFLGKSHTVTLPVISI